MILCFEVEKFFFEVSAAAGGEVSDRAIRADYSVAGDNQGNGVFCHDRAGCTDGFGGAGSLGKLGIGDGLAIADSAAGRKHLAGESGKIAQIDRYRHKISTFAPEIGPDLLL